MVHIDPRRMRSIGLFKIFIALAIFSVLVISVNAQVSLDGIDYESSVEESQDIVIVINASSDMAFGAEGISYELYYLGSLLSENATARIPTDYASSGTYEYIVVVRDNESAQMQNITVSVVDVPLHMRMLNPADRVVYNSSVQFVVEVNQDASTVCSLTINGSAYNMSFASKNASGTYYTRNVVLDDGKYSGRVVCQNEFDSNALQFSFEMSAAPLQISSKSYTLDQNSAVRLKVETSKISRCAYSVDDGMAIVQFSQTNSITHTSTLSLSEGTHTVSINCRSANNMTASENIIVVVSRKVSASVKIDPQGVLRAGTYDVVVETTKDVQNNPVLTYVYNNDNTPRSVYLSGSERKWHGYLIIEEGVGTKVGAFRFQGTDMDGVVGSIITDGEIFLVDTQKPIQVSAPVAQLVQRSNSRYSVELEWSYDSDDYDEFKVYRSEANSRRPELVETTQDMTFRDNDVESGESYSYTVAATDRAGNEGEQSPAVTITIPQTIEEKEPQAAVMDADLVKLVDEKIAELRVMILDIDAMDKRLSETSDPTTLEIAALLDLEEKIVTAKTNLENIVSSLESLKSSDISSSDLEVRLGRIRLDAIKAQSMVVEEIIVEERSEFEQLTSQGDVDAAAFEMLSGINVSKNQMHQYMDTASAMQDQIYVKTQAVSLRIRYLNQDTYDEMTIVMKTIKSSGKLENVSIIESIPKDVENSASQISFIDTQLPQIMKEDPVLRWKLDTLETKQIYYIVPSIVPSTSIKGVRTIVLADPRFSLTAGKVTGFVIFSNDNFKAPSMLQWMMFFGIGVVLSLLFYNFVVLERREKRMFHRAMQSDGRHMPQTRPTQNMYNERSLASTRKGAPSIMSAPIRHAPSIRSVPATRSAAITSAAQPIHIKSSRQSRTQMADTSRLVTPSDVMTKIDYCNSVINMLQYERARSLYNEASSAIVLNEEELALKKLSHTKAKIDAFRHIHDARRHLYRKDMGSLRVSVDRLNECYGTIAHNVGFMSHDDPAGEARFLGYIASNIQSLDKNKQMLERFSR